VVELTPALVPAGRFRRAAAFCVDLLLLAVVGHAFGAAFFDLVTRWGPYGRVFGLVVMTAYFALGASSVLSGQTLGKKAFGLEVAKLGGGDLGLAGAVGRASFLSLPYLANGWSAKAVLVTPVLAWGLAVIVFGIGGSMLYLFLFNRTTGQALHDLAFRTVVVKRGAAVPDTQPPLPRIHRVGLAGIGLAFVMVSLAGIWMKGWVEQALAPHTAFWAALNADPRFHAVGQLQHLHPRRAGDDHCVRAGVAEGLERRQGSRDDGVGIQSARALSCGRARQPAYRPDASL
jgi:uncharacterized RDD family membrane protein YckC